MYKEAEERNKCIKASNSMDNYTSVEKKPFISIVVSQSDVDTYTEGN